MSDDQYKKDMEIIEAASEGPWCGEFNYFTDNKSNFLFKVQNNIGDHSLNNCNYIRHFNPTYTKQLVQSLHDVTVERDALKQAIEQDNEELFYELSKKFGW